MLCTIRVTEYTEPNRRGADINEHETFEMDGSQVMVEVVKDWLTTHCTYLPAIDAALGVIENMEPDMYSVVRWTTENGNNIIALASRFKGEQT